MAGFEFSNSYVLKHILQIVPNQPKQLFYSSDNRLYIYHYDLSCYDTLIENISNISERLRLVGKIKNANVSVSVVESTCILRVSKV